jgi:hypothetical protein
MHRQTYTAGITGWNGTLYEALMTGLVPGAEYQYMVGSPSLQVWSQVRSFRAAVTPSKDAVARIAVTADQVCA